MSTQEQNTPADQFYKILMDAIRTEETDEEAQEIIDEIKKIYTPELIDMQIEIGVKNGYSVDFQIKYMTELMKAEIGLQKLRKS